MRRVDADQDGVLSFEDISKLLIAGKETREYAKYARAGEASLRVKKWAQDTQQSLGDSQAIVNLSAHRVDYLAQSFSSSMNADYERFLKKREVVPEKEYLAPKVFGTSDEPYLNQDIGDMLRSMMAIDSHLQSLKENLSLKTDFNLEDCYYLFDLHG